MNYINGSGTFQSEDVMHSRTSVRYRPSQTVIQSLILESKCVDLWVFRATVETLRGVSGELVGMLEHRSVNICCLLATRFKGKSVRIYYGKAAQYKLLWIWNGKGFVGVGIFLAKTWVDKVTNISRVSDKMIVRCLFKGLLFHWSQISLFMLHNLV